MGDAIAYPRRYSAAIGWKVLLCVLGALLGIGGLVGAGYFASGHEARNTAQMLALAGCSIGIAVLGFTCAWGSFATILVLRQDELEVPGVFRSTVIRRRDVRGFRIVPVQGINVLHVEWTHPVTGKAKRTKISVLFKPDAALMAWFDGMANFDAMEVAASVQEVADDPQLGTSAEERVENVNRARKIARVLHGVSWIGAGWALFYPHPYTLVLLLMAVLPALALWLCWKYKGSFSVEDRGPNAARADLTALLLVPGLILALRAMMDVHLAHPSELLVPTLVGLALVIGLIVWTGPGYRSRPITLVLMTALMAPYPASVVAIGNAMFDSGPGERYRVQVLRKRHTTGKGASQYFSVGAWGPYPAGYELQVANDLYHATQAGQTVCVIRHAGAFHMEWHTVHPADPC